MRAMIPTIDGSFVARSEVVLVRRLDSASEDLCEIVTSNGKTFVVEESAQSIAEGEEYFEEAISAPPGYFILFRNDSSFTKVPIIGWMKYKRINEKNNPGLSYWSKPIIAGLYDFGEHFEETGILFPDGRVRSCWIDRFYMNVEELENHIKSS
jgi:hypothetical protein